jgi:tRNA1Val (adenine37-N6)-methyltransferase
MANSFFQFKQFIIHQDRCGMKVTTDACLFGSLLPTSSGGEGEKKILEIGTGTGLLSLMYAQKNLSANIDAIEVDKEAYEQAKENFASSPWNNRINIIHGDVKTFPFEKNYDLIISNPPFYENELKSDNAKRNIALHNEGLLLEELLDTIKKNLKSDGRFYLLFPYKRNNEIDKLFTSKELAINHKAFVRQSTDHGYFRIIIAGTHQQEIETEFSTSEISIWNNEQQYTAEFIALLKDYYLHL